MGAKTEQSSLSSRFTLPRVRTGSAHVFNSTLSGNLFLWKHIFIRRVVVCGSIGPSPGARSRFPALSSWFEMTFGLFPITPPSDKASPCVSDAAAVHEDAAAARGPRGVRRDRQEGTSLQSPLQSR